MAKGFWRQPFIGPHVPAIRSCPPVSWSLPESTPVVATLWQRSCPVGGPAAASQHPSGYQLNSGVVSCWFFSALAWAERRWYTAFDGGLFTDCSRLCCQFATRSYREWRPHPTQLTKPPQKAHARVLRLFPAQCRRARPRSRPNSFSASRGRPGGRPRTPSLTTSKALTIRTDLPPVVVPVSYGRTSSYERAGLMLMQPRSARAGS